MGLWKGYRSEDVTVEMKRNGKWLYYQDGEPVIEYDGKVESMRYKTELELMELLFGLSEECIKRFKEYKINEFEKEE